MAKQSITFAQWVTNSISNLPNQVKGQATSLKTLFDKAALDIKTYVDTTLITELNGNNGANKIGLNNANLGADNVADGIEEVRQVAIQAQAGAIVDGSITNTKFDADVKVGSLGSLPTTDKSSATAAIGETYSVASTASSNASSANALATTANNSVKSLGEPVLTTGSSVAYAVTPKGVFDFSKDNNRLMVIPNVTNTAACTINVASTGAKSIRKADVGGSYIDVRAKDIKQGIPLELVWSLSNNFFILANGVGTITPFDDISGFSNGVEIDATTGRLQLYKNPQRIGAELTISEAKSSVYNTTYSISLSGQYQKRFNRAAFVTLLSSANPNFSLVVVLGLDKYRTVYMGTEGTGYFRSISKLNNDSLTVTASTALGAGLITGNTSHTFVIKVMFNDSTEFQPKIDINIASLSAPNYTIGLEASVMYI